LVWAKPVLFQGSIILEFIEPDRGGPGGSDHTPFLINGVPAYFLITRPWSSHPYYHQPQDDTEPIDVDLLQKTARFVYDNSLLISNFEGGLLIDQRLEKYIYKSAVIASISSIPYFPEKAVLDSLEKKHVDIQFFHISTETEKDRLTHLVDQLDTFYQDKSMGSHGDATLRRLFDSDREEMDPFIGIRGVESVNNSFQSLRVASKMGAKFFTFVGTDNSWILPDSGLTKAGKEALSIMNEHKMLTILENVPEKGLTNVLETSDLPVILLTDESIQCDSLMTLIEQTKSILALRYCPKSGIDDIVQRVVDLKEKIQLNHDSRTFG